MFLCQTNHNPRSSCLWSTCCLSLSPRINGLAAVFPHTAGHGGQGPATQTAFFFSFFAEDQHCDRGRQALLLPTLHLCRGHREHPQGVQRLPRHHPENAPQTVRTLVRQPWGGGRAFSHLLSACPSSLGHPARGSVYSRTVNPNPWSKVGSSQSHPAATCPVLCWLVCDHQASGYLCSPQVWFVAFVFTEHNLPRCPHLHPFVSPRTTTLRWVMLQRNLSGGGPLHHPLSASWIQQELDKWGRNGTFFRSIKHNCRGRGTMRSGGHVAAPSEPRWPKS